MELLEDLKLAQEKLDKIPKPPKRIEVTKCIYQALKNESDINVLIYGKPNCAHWVNGVTVRIATDEQQKDWTDEEKKNQFKIIYK